mgnify:CR=1 FL=1|tara:strand:- start:216 stop:1040 length:825 start_codon:yes stop_codon:yes gene_type:complete
MNLLWLIDSIRFNLSYKKLNFSDPQNFSEKLNYLKKFYRNKFANTVADKVRVRSYVKDRIGKKYLVPLIKIYNNASEIDFNELPQKFILKTNHGSGWNIICENKNLLDEQVVKRKFERWLSWNAYYLFREWQYKSINPKILCEKLLEYEIKDYKVYCFHGKPEYIQVDSGRFSNHTRIIYNTNWVRQDFSILYPAGDDKIEKPKKLNEMLSISEKLSQDFIFSRIDLYINENNIFFGEITLHPEGGICPIFPSKADKIFSDKLKLDEINTNNFK